MLHSNDSAFAEMPPLSARMEDADAPPARSKADLIPHVFDGFSAGLTNSGEFFDVKSDHPSAQVGLNFGRSDIVHVANSLNVRSVEWPSKVDLLGVEVSVTNYDQLVSLFITAARRRESALATFMAVHAIVTAATDRRYRYRINDFDVVAPDGQPVRWSLNLLHKAGLADRVCGPVLMKRLCAKAAEEGIGIYLYGSKPETLERLQANLEDQFPAIRILGVESPPFRPLTSAETTAAIDRINASGAGLVFIGLGCPRQDIFAHRNRHRIHAVQLCVGAAFDFHAGNTKMAPSWMQRHGLEWCYRLSQEPGRLWKRYLVTNTTFVLLMTRRLVLRK